MSKNARALRRFVAFPSALAKAGVSLIRPRLSALASDQGGNVVIVTALALPVLVGGSGLGLEVSYWYLKQRDMQNAADSAAVAAATNGSANYDVEAKAVAAQYGFEDGKNNVSIAVSNTSPCPSSAASNCYSVAITSLVPLFLSQVVGYSGNASVSSTVDGKEVVSPRTALSTAAIAARVASPRRYCVLALGSEGAKFEDVLVNGGSKSNLRNCGLMSNTDMRCNGQGEIADYADYASGSPSGCGREADRGPVAKFPDPYARLASNIPSNPCTSYSGEEWSGSKSLGAVAPICGDLKLTGNVEITSSTVLVIYNGALDTNGFTLRGNSLTIVFAGDNGGSPHYPIGGGTLDITAPTTGDWKGIALYQAPNLTEGVDIIDAGNAPTWNITGTVYLPHSDVTLSGAVNKSSSGNSCFNMVVASLTVNGTGYMLTNGDECAAAGVELPTYWRGRLVG